MRKNKTRKTQQIKGFLLFGLLLTLILIFIITALGRENFNSPHKLTLEILGLAQKGVSSLGSGGRSFWRDYVALWEVREQNKELRHELLQLQELNNQYREAVATNVRLGKLLELKETVQAPTVTARIIGRDPSLWYRNVIIDQGSSNGVQRGMPVVTMAGIVGQVMDPSPNFAKVLLALDPNSAIDMLIQENRVPGILKGMGDAYSLEYVQKNYTVNKGDRVVTSGLGGVFPKGLLAGTVSKVENNRHGMFQEIEVTPAVAFPELEFLLVILKNNPLTEQ